MYETFEHTADLGLRVQAETLPELFADAAAGLMSMIVEDVPSLREEIEVPIEVESDDVEYLLFDWLTELLYLFETKQLLVAKCNIQLGDNRLAGVVLGETCDAQRHDLAHEVKAITYHRLRVEKLGGKWHAEVIVDI